MKRLYALMVCVAAILLTSCYNSRILVGNVTPTEPLVEINKVWNHHLIFGLVPMGNATMKTSEFTDDAPNYVVKTNMSFLNHLVAELTLGIYTPTQTKYYIPLKDTKR